MLMLHWHILPIFNRSRVNRPFHFGWNFSTTGEICGVFGRNWHPKRQNFEKHLHRGHFLTSNRVFWAIVRQNRFTGMDGVYVWLGKKKIIMKSTWPRYFATWGRQRWYDPHQIWQGCSSAWRYHPWQIWKQTIHNDFCERLNFTVLALLGPSPLTWLSPAGLPVINAVHNELENMLTPVALGLSRNKKMLLLPAKADTFSYK